MKILLNILLAAGLTGLVYSIAELPFTAVGVFNFTFVTALVAWTLAQYEPRKRPVWMPKRSELITDGSLRTHRWVRTLNGRKTARSATSI
jgi:hypothetical protein